MVNNVAGCRPYVCLIPPPGIRRNGHSTGSFAGAVRGIRRSWGLWCDDETGLVLFYAIWLPRGLGLAAHASGREYDITLGILALIAPTRAGLLYMGCWGFFTALLRPLAGEGGWEFLERSYNFGVPF